MKKYFLVLPFLIISLLGCRERPYRSFVYVNITYENLNYLNSIWQSVSDFKKEDSSEICTWYTTQLKETKYPVGVTGCIDPPEQSWTNALAYSVTGQMSPHHADSEEHFKMAKQELDALMEKIRQAIEKELGREVKKRSHDYLQPII